MISIIFLAKSSKRMPKSDTVGFKSGKEYYQQRSKTSSTQHGRSSSYKHNYLDEDEFKRLRQAEKEIIEEIKNSEEGYVTAERVKEILKKYGLDYEKVRGKFYEIYEGELGKYYVIPT